MTKMKNTKKGMAKKALSISLVAAMLATSNVPVWAAFEADDATPIVVETPAAEAPVEEEPQVDAFSEESTVEVEGIETTASEAKTDLTIHDNGWFDGVSVTGNVYDVSGQPMKQFFYIWWVNGKAMTGNYGVYDITNGNISSILHLDTTSENCGDQVQLGIYNYDGSKPTDLNDIVGSPNNAIFMSNAVTVSKEKVSQFYEVKPIDTSIEINNHKLTYGSDVDLDDFTLFAKANTNILGLTDADFIKNVMIKEGDGVSAESVLVVNMTPKNKDLYSDILEYDLTIVEKGYKNGDIKGTVTKVYEYTGNTIKLNPADITLTDTVTDRAIDAGKVITQIDTDYVNRGDGVAHLTLENVDNFINTTLPGGPFADRLVVGFKIGQRDLSNCVVKIDTFSYNGTEVAAKNDSRFKGKVHIYDKTTNEELNLRSVWDKDNTGKYDYDIIVTELPSAGTHKYEVTIQAPTSNATGNTSGSVVSDFVIGNHTFADEGYELSQDVIDKLEETVVYTGKDAVKDTSIIKFTKGNTVLSPENYTVTVYGKDAGAKAGKVVIKGLKSYEECEETYYFNINPAVIDQEDIVAASKVIFNKGYTSADQYAPAVTVKTRNGITLTKDEFTTNYYFERTNMIGNYILSKIHLTSNNFVIYDGTDNGTKTLYAGNKTLIAKRQLSNCTMEVLGTYTYTAGVIKPIIKVMDGNEELTEGVDYEVASLKNAIDVGTATITIRGVGNDANPADGIYDTQSKLSANFEITPANAKDVEVIFADGNTGITYTGSTIKPTILKVTLNGNDVSKQFDYSYPTLNVNVGKGHVLLTPVTGNKNFIGTKDAEFNIIARELEGTLHVYDENNVEYTIDNYGWMKDISGKYVKYAFDGKEHTFAKAEFVPSGDYAKYVTKDDYEIKYADNIYGETAYIYVVGKGNFKGTDSIKNNDGDEIISSVATKYKYTIENYTILKQHVSINDGEYSAGLPVRPNVVVTVGNKELVEDKDYALEYKAVTEVSKGKLYKVIVKGINGYKGEITGYWGVVKKDLANTDIEVVSKSSGDYEVIVKNTGIVVPTSEYDVKQSDSKTITVTAKEDSQNYTGSQTVTIDKTVLKAPVVTASVDRNIVDVSLTAVDDATAYDYVLCQSAADLEEENYFKSKMSVDGTSAEFQFVRGGQYYVYARAAKRDENGKKVVSDWSVAAVVDVTCDTPNAPTVTKVTTKGNTVTVTYTTGARTEGVDVIIGGAVRKQLEDDAMRPVNYNSKTGLIKNVPASTKTVTFTNVAKGTYFVGVHPYITSNDGLKYFGRWSKQTGITKVVVG